MLEHSSAHHTSVAEGNKGPPLLQLLRPAGGYKGPPLLQLLRPAGGYKGPPFASIVTTRRRVQGSPLCFNCYDPPEGTRVPPLLQLLRPAGGYKGPPFASIVTTRSRRRLRRDFRGRPPTFATTLSTVLGFHLSVPLAPLQRKGARVPGAISASKSCKRVKTCRWSPLGADRR